jgi:uncharacterized membrane protein YidH (DUF202 family)
VSRRGVDRTLIVAGLATIVVGALELLDQLGAIDMRFRYTAPLLLAAAGVVLLVAGLS